MACENCEQSADRSLDRCENCEEDLSNPTSLETPAVRAANIESSNKKRFSWSHFNPNAMDLEVAQKHIRNAFWAAVISIAVTIGLAAAGLVPSEVWMDVGFALLLAIGIFKKSRVAAGLMVAYFVASKILLTVDGTYGQIGSGIGVMAILFLYYYLMGFLGSIRYHQLNPFKASKWTYILGTGGCASALLVFVIWASFQPLITPAEIFAEIDSSAHASQSLDQTIYEADYTEGYKSGYADGRSEYGMFGDMYNPPATEGRRNPYGIGYLDGYLLGCQESKSDCRDVASAVDLINSSDEVDQVRLD